MFCLHVCLYTMCLQCPQRPGEGVRFPETRITDGCEPTCWCWESNLDHLEQQPVLLTALPLLHPQKWKVWVGQCMYLCLECNHSEKAIIRKMNRSFYALIGTIATCLPHNPFWYFPFCFPGSFPMISSDYLFYFCTILFWALKGQSDPLLLLQSQNLGTEENLTSFGFIASLRSAQATWNPVSKNRGFIYLFVFQPLPTIL